MDSIPTPPDSFSGIALDGFTVADLPAVLADLFFLPGDWLLWSVAEHTPGLARFLDIGTHGYGGVLSGCLSAFVWIASLILVSISYRAVRDFDDALTRAMINGCKDLRRRTRIASTLAMYRLRERGKRRSSAARTLELDAEELVLDDQALRLLRAHADLAPGCALPLSEAAAALRCRRHEAQRVLDRLIALQLVRSALGAPDGESAHVLTPAGRGFLLFKQMMPKTAPPGGSGLQTGAV